MENLDIVYEDAYLIAINKGISESVQRDKTGDISLSDKVLSYLNKKGTHFCGVIHRIDKPVSGIVCFAKQKSSLVNLNQQIQEKKIKKTYWAVATPAPVSPEGKLVHFLKKNPKLNKSFVVSESTPGAKLAILEYRQIGASERYVFLEIVLHTGRHHQIRSQLSSIGYHIKGDIKYGFPRTNRLGGILLHAYQIECVHPHTGESLIVTAEPGPDPLWDLFKDAADLSLKG